MAVQPINLHDKFEKTTQEIFKKESVIGGLLSSDYKWEGVRTIKVSTIMTVPENDYERSGENRFGDPTEVGDIVQELTVTQDKGFSATVDKGNYVDQSKLKTAATVVARQLKEVSVPNSDAYILNRLAGLAGTIKAHSTVVDKDSIMDRITDGTVALDDAEVPESNRSLLVSAKVYKMIRMSPEFIGTEKMAVKSLRKGQVGEVDNMPVIKVPQGRWPKGVNFMIVYKNSGIAPFKIDDTYMHENPPGLSGIRVEGRRYYDCFVFGAKSEGIYVDLDTNEAQVVAAPVVTLSNHSATVTAVSGVTFYYTTDGSDPRYSASAKAYTGAVTTAAGDTFKVYGTADGKYPSVVASVTDA